MRASEQHADRATNVGQATRWVRRFPRRVRIAAAGYAVVAIFAAGIVLARAIGTSVTGATTVGMLAAAPVVISLVGDRITQIKAFSVEVSLQRVTVPVARDIGAELSQAVEDTIAEAAGSAVTDLSSPFTSLMAEHSKLLRINLRDDNYWWSTRIFLVAALAQDYTDVQALVFVRSADRQVFVGIASPGMVRGLDTMTAYEAAYRSARAKAAAEALYPGDEVNLILQAWQYSLQDALGQGEEQIKQIISSEDLRKCLGKKLDRGSVPDGPLTERRQYRIISHDHRYVALTNHRRFKKVVDRDMLAVEVARAQLERTV